MEPKEISRIFDYYKLNGEDRRILWEIIMPIFSHEEFQRRMDASIFPHHDKTSLGTHIISDAVVTYLLAKKKLEKNQSINVQTAVIIAMFHDLYELPWQNAMQVKSSFVNKHGFVHPLESSINSAFWYPEYFKDLKRAKIIIDGIVHHMFPFPVRAIDEDIEKLELNNTEKFYDLSQPVQELIVSSSQVGLIKPLHISLSPASSSEGRCMSQADKIVAMGKDATSLNGIKACITGINPNLETYDRVRKKRQ